MTIKEFQDTKTGNHYRVAEEKELSKLSQSYGSKRNFKTLVKEIKVIEGGRVQIDIGNGDAIIV